MSDAGELLLVMLECSTEVAEALGELPEKSLANVVFGLNVRQGGLGGRGGRLEAQCGGWAGAALPHNTPPHAALDCLLLGSPTPAVRRCAASRAAWPPTITTSQSLCTQSTCALCTLCTLL